MKFNKIVFALTGLILTACNLDEQEELIIDPVDSSVLVTKVFDWTPAPGQFVNDPTGGNSWPDDMSADEACAWALERFKKNYTVTLGSFGGYIVAGFDHPVKNTEGGYEIGILGNAFNSAAGDSNEPGIVYVMQDTNGNGLPDDIWYELKGSDTFATGTIRNYSVTYYRPSGPEQPIKWIDNQGNSGEVPYMKPFHTQPSYFPVWVKGESYTLSGTCMPTRSSLDPETGNWSNRPFEWGYADNMGADCFEFAGSPNCNRFRISDAIDIDGKPVNLTHINFVKVQTGVLGACGRLGEISTEVSGIFDLTL